MSSQASANPFFAPTQISGCQLWLDAADTNSLVSSGSNVSLWRDKSGSNNNATQNNLANQPTRGTQLNGLNVLNFTGSQPFFSLPTLTYTNITVFTIFRNTTLRAYCSPLFLGPFFFFFTDGAGGNVYGTGRLGVNGEGVVTQAAAGITTQNYLLYSLNLTVAATDIVNFYINGSNLANFNGAASGGRSYYQVGSTDAVGATTGFTAEIIVYNGVLNNIQRQQVEGYLAWKWGLQANLPLTHPYKNSPIPPLLNPPRTLPLALQNTTVVGWSPRLIPGLTVWLDAADTSTLSLTGTTVNSWTSKASSLIANSVGGGAIVYSNFNNFPGLYFNGTNTRMNTTTIPSYGSLGTTWLTASINLTPVVENSTPVDASVVFATLSGTAPEKSIRYNFPPQFIIYTFNNGQIRGGRSNNDNGIRGFIDSGPSMYAFVNGVDITLTQLSATYQEGINQSFQLGQWNTGWLLGYIQEVLVYNTALSIPQYQLAEGYLAWKWGFQGSLASNHPYRRFPPISPTNAFPPRSIATATVWQPTQIPTCAVWLDSYRVDGVRMPTNNTTVSTWVNLVSGGSNFTQATVSRQPTFVANSINSSQPSLFFNSSNTAASIQFLFAGPNVQTTRDISFFYVAQYINVGGDQTQVDQRKDINAVPLRTIKASQNQIRDPAGNLYTLNFTSTPLVPTIRSYRDTLNTINGYYNGTLVTNSSGTYNQQVADNYGILIGCHFDAMNNNTIASLTFSKYYMAEYIMYNRYLTLSEQQQVEGYLAWKWGLQGSLPTNHPWKRWPPPP